MTTSKSGMNINRNIQRERGRGRGRGRNDKDVSVSVANPMQCVYGYAYVCICIHTICVLAKTDSGVKRPLQPLQLLLYSSVKTNIFLIINSGVYFQISPYHKNQLRCQDVLLASLTRLIEGNLSALNENLKYGQLNS